MPALKSKNSEGLTLAFSGPKGIYISDSRLRDIFNSFLEREDFSEARLDEYLDKLGKLFSFDPKIYAEIKRTDENFEFSVMREEITHFQLVRRTAIGKLLYLWNPLVRYGYTAWTSRIDDWSRQLSRPMIFQEMIRHQKANIIFYNYAAPIVEGQILLLEGTKKEEMHYLAPIGDGAEFLRDRALRSTEASIETALDFDSLAAYIDDAVGRHVNKFGLASGHVDYDPQPCPPRLIRLALQLKVPATPFAARRALPLVGRMVWLHRRAFLSVLKRAVATPKRRRRIENSSELGNEPCERITPPALWTPHRVADPVAFGGGQRFISRSEATFRWPRDKTLSDLLWYVTVRSLETALYRTNGYNKVAIKASYTADWPALLGGTELWPDLAQTLHQIDEAIVDLAYTEPSLFDQTAHELTQRLQPIFQVCREIVETDPDFEVATVGQAINKQYLQV